MGGRDVEMRRASMYVCMYVNMICQAFKICSVMAFL